jgi:hypothetical protein
MSEDLTSHVAALLVLVKNDAHSDMRVLLIRYAVFRTANKATPVWRVTHVHIQPVV